MRHPREIRFVVAIAQTFLWTKDKVLGHRTSSPSWWKRHKLIKYASLYSLTQFVETGTYLGDTSLLMSKRKMSCKSIEISSHLADRARQRFENVSHVEIYEGDSATLLPQIWSFVNEPTLVWLDGHFSGGITSSGLEQSPLVAELSTILSSSIASECVIAIDDLQDLDGSEGYASIQQLQDLAQLHEFSLKTHGSVVFLVPDQLSNR